MKTTNKFRYNSWSWAEIWTGDLPNTTQEFSYKYISAVSLSRLGEEQ
jgi:hypothetical protein